MNLHKNNGFFKATNILIVVLIGLFVIIIINTGNISARIKTKLASGWKVYSGNDYSISYPGNSIAPEVIGSSDVVIETSDYKLNMTNGNIDKGYVIAISKNVGFDYDNLDSCNRNPNNWNKESGKCLLGYGNSMIHDYANGKVTKEKLSVNGTPAVKFQFTSTSGKNNSTGIIVNGKEKSYIIMIGYKDFQNQPTFDKILFSFKLKAQ